MLFFRKKMFFSGKKWVFLEKNVFFRKKMSCIKRSGTRSIRLNQGRRGLKTRARHTPKCKQGDGNARRATTQPGAPGPVLSPNFFPQDGNGPRRAPPGLRPRGQQSHPGVQNSDGGRPSTGPGRGGPREEDGVRAAVDPIDRLGWRSGLSLAAGREKPGGSEQKRCEPGDGRDRAGRHGPNLERLGRGGKIRSELEDGRDGHMLSRAIKFAVTTSRTFEEPNDTLPLILYLALVLPWPGAESKRRSRRERARRRGPSPILSPTQYLVIVLPWPGAE